MMADAKEAKPSPLASSTLNELVEQAKAGDEAAFNELHRRYYDGTLGMCRASLGDPDVARLAADETFADAFTHIRTFRGKAKFTTWLYKICERRILKHKQGTKQAKSEETGHDLELVEPAGPGSRTTCSPEELHERRLGYLDLVKDILGLPKEESTTMVLLHGFQLSVAEAAWVLGVSEDAVYMRVSRARKRLRNAKEDG